MDNPENTKGAIKWTIQRIPKGQRKGQSRGTGNIWYTRRRETKQNTTQCVLDTTMHKQTQIIS